VPDPSLVEWNEWDNRVVLVTTHTLLSSDITYSDSTHICCVVRRFVVDSKTSNIFRARLRGLLSRIDGDLDSESEVSHHASGGQGTGELTNVPFHLGDMGTEEFLFQLNSALLNNQSQLREQVIDALHRIDEGNYGVCEHCGVEILAERLEVLPFTSVCMGCANLHPSASVNLNDGRPRGPADTLAPEGEMGESRWQSKSNDDSLSYPEDGNQRKGSRREADSHAVGTPGGGDASGGLAGSNSGHGDPQIADLEDAMGNGGFDPDDADDEERPVPRAGRGGGAVGGSPANNRASG
jgi:DnaK suppressor protein